MLDRYLADLEDKIYFRSRDGWHSPIELLLALLESAGLTPVTGSALTRSVSASKYEL